MGTTVHKDNFGTGDEGAGNRRSQTKNANYRAIVTPGKDAVDPKIQSNFAFHAT
jgi:hypothetical protein